jgi:hypothetical protein
LTRSAGVCGLEELLGRRIDWHIPFLYKGTDSALLSNFDLRKRVSASYWKGEGSINPFERYFLLQSVGHQLHLCLSDKVHPIGRLP